MEISENSLIKKLKKFGKTSDNVLRGIGDDGAVVTMSGGQYVFVQDAMVEHVHFEFSFLDPYYVGKKAIAVNVSDILAMGALPLYFLVTIGVPARMSSPDIEKLYKGMKDASRPYNIILLGGDTVGADSFFIDISMVGKLVTNKYLGRDKAREGDLIAVTGYLGEAAYGLHLLLNGIKEKGSGTCIKRFQDPRSPYGLWKELIKRDITVAMMDVSDGLIIDLERMMVESKKSARVDLENLPVPTILKKNGMEKLALTGGEDYQLLLTFSPKKLSQVKKLQEEGHKISIIGKVAKDRGVKLFKNSKEILLTEKGYQHFNGKPHE